MEKSSTGLQSSYSWWWESHNNRPNQSEWLQTTLSDLDKKVKQMVNLIEEDGDTFAKRAEMYYKKRPELIKMVEDLHRSYRALADDYDQLRCECSRLPPPTLLQQSPNSLRQAVKHLEKPKNVSVDSENSHSKDSLEDPINPSFGKARFEAMNGHADDEITANKMETEELKTKIDEKGDGLEYNNCSLERVTKLVEENLQQQAKLIMRNEEKREAIKDLCERVDRLMNENVALKTALSKGMADVKQNKSQLTKMKGAILGKFLRP